MLGQIRSDMLGRVRGIWLGGDRGARLSWIRSVMLEALGVSLETDFVIWV